MVSDHVYKELSMLKSASESFSKVIDKFIHLDSDRKEFKDFAGAWSCLSEDTLETIEKGAKAARKNWRPVPKW